MPPLPSRRRLTGGLAAVLALASPAVAQLPGGDATAPPPVPGAPPVRTAVEALAEDAEDYARHYDVTLAEAMARLRAQEASVAATDRLAADYRERLAGIAIEHRPGYRIVILLTGTEPVSDAIVDAGGQAVPVVFRTGAVATRDQILAAIVRDQAAIRQALLDPPGMGVDQRTGALVVTVTPADAARSPPAELAVRFAALTGVPVRVIVPGIGDADFGAAGGMRLQSEDPVRRRRVWCTSGFVVTDGVRTGLATAAHCPDALVAIDADGAKLPLGFVGQWGARFQDVQINASDTPLRALFHAGADPAARRALTGWRNRTSTRAGDFVCHQGERTGFSCAEVALVDYAPPGDLCGGPCTPDWVVVAGPSCGHGDSGGPVFSATLAFGILKGGSYRADGSCSFYYYMSTDYLPPGWSLLHE